jgi:hypothetical protein
MFRSRFKSFLQKSRFNLVGAMAAKEKRGRGPACPVLIALPAILC